MAHSWWLGLAMVMMLAAPAGAQTPASPAPANPPAAQPAPGPVYRLTFFEVSPAAAGKTAGLLRQYAAATGKAAGNAGVVALHEITRPGRFALVEVWRDRPAVEAGAAALAGLGDQLKPLFASPFDTRSNAGLDVAGPPLGGEPGAGRAVYVLTHVDVFPAGKDQTIDMLKRLAADSRKDPGNLRFEVLQQDGRSNHLPLIETWRDAGAREAHAMAEHTRAFRAQLVPLQGALYDERVYQHVR